MGKLTTHVLDTASGRPGAGVDFRLFKLGNEKVGNKKIGDKRQLLRSGTTNSDGRADEPLLDDDGFEFGTYEIDFQVGNYFAASALPTDEVPFLDEITLRFTISKDQHYHVPLLVSPWSYSTYRGS